LAAQVLGAETSNPNHNLHAVYELMVGGESPTDLDAWIFAYGLFNNTVRALDSASLAELVKRECTYVVETATMKIRWKLCSCTTGSCEPSIVPGLVELDTALAGG